MWRIVLLLLLALITCSVQAQSCRQITSPANLQSVVSGAEGGEVSVCLDDSNQGSNNWTLAGSAPLIIKPNQKVSLNCKNQTFSDGRGHLTMGRGSVLAYENCHMQQYDYPQSGKLYGSMQHFQDSWIGMESCQFVEALGERYALVLSKSQENATFLVGELHTSELGLGSAVHMFYVAFNSLEGQQVRFIHQNTTAYCGDPSVVAKAREIATKNGPVITISSDSVVNAEPQPSGSSPAAEQDSKKSKAQLWFTVIASVAGISLVFLIGLGCYFWRKRSQAQDALAKDEESGPQTSEIKTSIRHHTDKLREKLNIELA